MNIEITKAVRRDTPVLRQLYELYEHDFSVYTHADVHDTGMYTDGYFLAHEWRDPKWSAFLIRVDSNLAGFAWVLQTTLFEPGWPETQVLAQSGLLMPGEHVLMEEFFIMRKYRLQGVGEYAAHHLFDRYTGIWEVSEMIENTPAQAFWRKVIERYTHNHYVELNLNTSTWRGPVQVFRSRK